MIVKCTYCKVEFIDYPSRIKRVKNKFCSKACILAYKSDPKVIENRFWSYVDVREEDECWLWTGALVGGGRGVFSRHPNGKDANILAHIFSYIIHFGNIKNGLQVCHTCDNPPCVNPSHLWLGTQQDNMDDMCMKGRQGNTRGGRNGMTILTEDNVIEIRVLRAVGWTYQALSDRFNVSPSQISRIAKRERWAHVQ